MTGDSSGGGESVAGGVDPEHPERRVVDHLARERTHHLLRKKLLQLVCFGVKIANCVLAFTLDSYQSDMN